MAAGNNPLFAPGGGGGGAAGTTGYNGGNGAPGSVVINYTAATAPYYNVMRFLLNIPSGGITNGATICGFNTTGTVAKVKLVYSSASGGGITMSGYDISSTLLFTSSTFSGLNGDNLVVSLEVWQLAPGTLGYQIQYIAYPSGIPVFDGSVISGSMGAVEDIFVDPTSNVSGAAIGHITIQYAYEPLTDILPALSGYNGELAGTRFERLCTLLGIAYEFRGNPLSTPAMGPQINDTPMNVFQQIEDLDRGMLYEPRDMFGLGYRNYDNLINQTPALVANYSLAQLSALTPSDDDQDTKNDVTITRTNGSGYSVKQTTGPLSVNAPPNGVGDYPFSLTVNSWNDSQLSSVAAIVLADGTVDESRYTGMEFDLTRYENYPIFTNVLNVMEGDFVQITNPPSFLNSETINQLARSFNENISAFEYNTTFTSIPETPYET